MEDSFEMLRSERRSFFCPNKLWKELLEQTSDCISVSSYIKMAILEKMIRDEPEKKEYFESLTA
ncbi:hypothetical protein JXM83_00390 [Candidatus Woesearchaeota archaeon]|nr:hypothetical protein [Candidatus Woesearchaeota archaeon]